MISPQVTLIIKLTNACNMKCRYCFIEPAVFHKTMKIETARRVIRSFLDSEHFQSVHFVWHGGEPLLRGRRFFEALLAEQNAHPTRVSYTNAIQTNATHLDDEMLDFLLANGFRIGLSLDGPESLNDGSRQMRDSADPRSARDHGGCGETTQEKGTEPTAIVVVNRNNVGDPEAIYSEFKREGIHMKINPLTRSGLAATAGPDLGVTAGEYGSFLVRMFDLWFEDPEPSILIEPSASTSPAFSGFPPSRAAFSPGAATDFFSGSLPTAIFSPAACSRGSPLSATATSTRWRRRKWGARPCSAVSKLESSKCSGTAAAARFSTCATAAACSTR